jgi:glycosyltransferase involved in cell wall biosynthesis
LKLSLCITVRNEQGSIAGLMESLLTQSRAPDELIIVDGGSTDGTAELLRTYVGRHPCLNVIALPNINIAEGRNISIMNARYAYIASADAGVEYPKKWLENLVRALESDPAIDVASGYFEPKPETRFEACVGNLLYPNQNLMNWSKFLPHGSSVAFKKKVWEELGGYAEWLPRGIGEDTHFFLRAQKAGYRFAYATDATCYWRPRRNFAELFKQYFLYAKGACISRSSRTFVFEAYGANPLVLTIKNLGSLVRKGRPLDFGLSILILSVVLMAKITGSIVGLMQRGHRSPQTKNKKDAT